MRVLAAAAIAAALLGGCTSVRMVRRDGCWIKQTEKFPRRVTEEIGPCARKEPVWVEDRLTRLVQECVAAADYRWQVRALAAFNRGDPLPPQQSEQSVLESCMLESTRTLLTEHEAMTARIGELSAEREQLRSDIATADAHLRSSHDKLGDALGEATKKPAPSAVATATARGDGNATTTTDLQSSSDMQSQASHAAELSVPPARKVDVRVGQSNVSRTKPDRPAMAKTVAPTPEKDAAERPPADCVLPGQEAAKPDDAPADPKSDAPPEATPEAMP